MLTEKEHVLKTTSRDRFKAVSRAINFTDSTGVLISPYPDQEGNKLGSMSGTRAISTISSRELSSGHTGPVTGSLYIFI